MLYDMTQKFFHLFCLHFYSTGEQVPLIKDWKDVLNKVGDNQVLLQSIKGLLYRFHEIFKNGCTYFDFTKFSIYLLQDQLIIHHLETEPLHGKQNCQIWMTF